MSRGVAGIRALMVSALAVGVALPAWAQDTLRVGFRQDARPFSYVDSAGRPDRTPQPVGMLLSLEAAPEDGSAARPIGFLADLCYAALDSQNVDVEAVIVTAANRFAELSRPSAEGGIDLLCDPTSMRKEILDTFLFSPQVFATGVGFLRHSRSAAGRIPADRGDVVVGYLNGTTAGTAVTIAELRRDIEPIRGGTIVHRRVDDHDAGITKVCSGEFEYYFGDLDILKALLSDKRDSGMACDAVRDSGDVIFSYEAYALAVDPARPDAALALQAGLYRVFSDGTANEIYEAYFAGKPKTNPLQAVFSLNTVLPCSLSEALGVEPCSTAGISVPPPHSTAAPADGGVLQPDGSLPRTIPLAQ